MENKNLATLTNEELLQEVKKMNTTRLFDAGIYGLLIGIALFSTIKAGFGVFTFIPVAYLPFSKKNNAKYKVLQQLLKERNLQ